MGVLAHESLNVHKKRLSHWPALKVAMEEPKPPATRKHRKVNAFSFGEFESEADEDHQQAQIGVNKGVENSGRCS